MRSSTVGLLVGVAGFLLTAELLCRLLPVSSATLAGYYIDPDILTYAPHHRWRYATGWDLRNPQSLRTNGHGFVSDHEFTRNSNAVALIGDSFVEAASLDAPDRPAAQLERALGGGRPVYAMGSAGASLLDHAERIRYAHQQFGVRDFVVLVERGDLLQALCGSANLAGQCLDPGTLALRSQRAAEPSALKRAIRHSAFAQYLVSQLKLAPGGLLQQLRGPATPQAQAQAPAAAASPASAPEHPAGSADAAQKLRALDAVSAAFFARVKPYVTGRLVLAVHSDLSALLRHQTGDDAVRGRFMAAARAAGATVVDTEPIFQAHFAGSDLSLQLGPNDGHFNRVAVGLVTGAVATALPR